MTTSGQRIRALRKKKRWTIAQLADRAHIDRSAMTNIEIGAISLGKVRAQRIATALGVGIEAVWRPREDAAVRRDFGRRLRELEVRAAKTERTLVQILKALDGAGIGLPDVGEESL